MVQWNKKSIVTLGKQILRHTPKLKKQPVLDSGDDEAASHSASASSHVAIHRQLEMPSTGPDIQSRMPPSDSMEVEPSPGPLAVCEESSHGSPSMPDLQSMETTEEGTLPLNCSNHTFRRR